MTGQEGHVGAADHAREKGQEVVEQAQEKGQQLVSEARSQVQERAAQGRSQAAERMRVEVDRRSTEVGEHGQSLAEALRRSAEQLQGEGKEAPARLAQRAADQVERPSRYLRDADADRLLGELEDLARSRPWLAGSVGALVGFVASRFLRASSDRRYESRFGSHTGASEGLEREAAAPGSGPGIEPEVR
jgi:gas vesicle protein